MNLQITYDKQLTNKVLARERKNTDKTNAEKDPELCVAVFDLEKV